MAGIQKGRAKRLPNRAFSGLGITKTANDTLLEYCFNNPNRHRSINSFQLPLKKRGTQQILTDHTPNTNFTSICFSVSGCRCSRLNCAYLKHCMRKMRVILHYFNEHTPSQNYARGFYSSAPVKTIQTPFALSCILH